MSAQTDDKVWFDTGRKFAGLCADIKSLTAQSTNVLLLSHFPSTQNALHQALRAASIEFGSFSLADSSLLCSSSSTGKVWSGLARAFQPATSQIGEVKSGSTLQVLVTEHHPINGKDRTLVESVERLPCSPSICFHISLDDPLMMHFGGERLIELFKRLGADEAESLSHPFVTHAIKNAQEKIEKQVQRDVATESMEDWFRFNMRE